MWVMFLAIFLGVIAGIVLVALHLRNKLKRYSRQVLGTDDFDAIVDAISEENQVMTPKSVSGMDSILMPQILEDFPDFDADQAKTQAGDYIKTQLSDKQSVKINKIVFSRYHEAESQKTIVMQASVAYQQNDRTVQTRYQFNYSFLLSEGCDTVAANCPNCGGALSFGQRNCPYCGAQVINVMGNTWEFNGFREL